MKDKVLSAAAAAALVRSGDTITTSGFVGIGVADGLLQALAERFAETGEPRDLTLVFAAGQGDGKEWVSLDVEAPNPADVADASALDRKSTRLNSSHRN